MMRSYGGVHSKTISHYICFGSTVKKEPRLIDWLAARLQEGRTHSWCCDQLNLCGFKNDQGEPVNPIDLNRFMSGAGNLRWVISGAGNLRSPPLKNEVEEMEILAPEHSIETPEKPISPVPAFSIETPEDFELPPKWQSHSARFAIVERSQDRADRLTVGFSKSYPEKPISPASAPIIDNSLSLEFNATFEVLNPFPSSEILPLISTTNPEEPKPFIDARSREVRLLEEPEAEELEKPVFVSLSTERHELSDPGKVATVSGSFTFLSLHKKGQKKGSDSYVLQG
jgi:hypothetical protein